MYNKALPKTANSITKHAKQAICVANFENHLGTNFASTTVNVHRRDVE